MSPPNILGMLRASGIAENITASFTAEDVQWMNAVPNSETFLEWFTDYITECNVASDLLIAEYDALCEDSSISKKDVDNALAEYGVTIDKCLDSTQEYLFSLEEDGAELLLLEKSLEKATLILKTEVNTVERQRLKEDDFTRNTGIVLLKEGQNVMKLSAQYKSCLQIFSQVSSKCFSMFVEESKTDKPSNYLFSHMNVYEFLEYCSKIERQQQLYMKRLFKKQPSFLLNSSETFLKESSNEVPRQSAPSSWLSIFGDIPQKMKQIGVEKIAFQALLNGILYEEHNISEMLKELPTNNVWLRFEIEHLQEEVNCLIEKVNDILKGTVSALIEKAVLNEVTSVALKVAHQRIERRKTAVLKLEMLQKFLDKRVWFSELVRMLLLREAKIISILSQTFSDECTFLKEEHCSHLATMAKLCNIEKNHVLWSTLPIQRKYPFFKMLCGLLVHQEGNLDNVFTYDSFNQMNGQIKSEIFSGLTSQYNQLLEGEQSQNELRKVLLGGFTKKPSLYSSNVLYHLHKAQGSLNNDAEEVFALRKLFSMKKLALDRLLHNQRCLWAWFLVAPDCLENAFQFQENKRNA